MILIMSRVSIREISTEIFQKVAGKSHHKNTTQITTFYHPKTTTSPQKNHQVLPIFAKTPPKNHLKKNHSS